jgi:hypothetical protein
LWVLAVASLWLSPQLTSRGLLLSLILLALPYLLVVGGGMCSVIAFAWNRGERSMLDRISGTSVVRKTSTLG